MGLETYEVWSQKANGSWCRVVDADREDLFSERKHALEVAECTSKGEDVVEVVVIERRPCFRVNGPALISHPARRAMFSNARPGLSVRPEEGGGP